MPVFLFQHSSSPYHSDRFDGFHSKRRDFMIGRRIVMAAVAVYLIVLGCVMYPNGSSLPARAGCGLDAGGFGDDCSCRSALSRGGDADPARRLDRQV